MNCQDFETIAVELARAQLMDARAREAANAHAAACGECAERLRREAALTDALRQVGAASRETCAPPRVEAALLAAFRERHAAAPAAAFETAPAGSPLTFAARRHAPRRLIATAAVAASLLLALSAAWRALAPQSPSSSPQGASGNPQNVVSVGHTPDIKPAIKEVSSPNLIEASSSHGATPAPAVIDVKDVRTPRQIAARGARPAKPQRDGAFESLPISFTVDGGQVRAGEDESASASQAAPQGTDVAASADFVQLATGDSSAPLESGQMVRVQVPRAALAALGLPVNAERASEMVKADILLAHDGTARAIRLRP
jgi:hypothetical protein